MDIGKKLTEHTIQPAVIPVPRRETINAPEEPVRMVPQEDPEFVPAHTGE